MWRSDGVVISMLGLMKSVTVRLRHVDVRCELSEKASWLEAQLLLQYRATAGSTEQRRLTAQPATRRG